MQTQTATVLTYNGAAPYRVTGRIKREYPKGLTIEDERGIVYYADFERVTRGPAATPEDATDAGSAWLW